MQTKTHASPWFWTTLVSASASTYEFKPVELIEFKNFAPPCTLCARESLLTLLDYPMRTSLLICHKLDHPLSHEEVCFLSLSNSTSEFSFTNFSPQDVLPKFQNSQPHQIIREDHLMKARSQDSHLKAWSINKIICHQLGEVQWYIQAKISGNANPRFVHHSHFPDGETLDSVSRPSSPSTAQWNKNAVVHWTHAYAQVDTQFFT